jgi:hypothetical protein
MTPAAFTQSLKAKSPPAGASAALQALWWAANDNWAKAHRIVMNGHDQDCAWVVIVYQTKESFLLRYSNRSVSIQLDDCKGGTKLLVQPLGQWWL